MPQESFIEKQEESIVVHIFTVSAAMVGVCLTVIGIINVLASLNKMQTWADDVTALDAVVFLISCLISYTAIKTKNRKNRLIFENIADVFFLSALIGMVFICIFIVYSFMKI